jgi:hypothetical protein
VIVKTLAQQHNREQLMSSDNSIDGVLRAFVNGASTGNGAAIAVNRRALVTPRYQ